MTDPVKPPPKYQKPDPTELAGDIVFVQAACNTIMGLAPEMSDEDRKEMEAIIALDALPAKAQMMGAFTGLVGPEVIYQTWAKTRNAMDFLARHALSIMTEVLDGRRISAQQMRVCEKLVEWSGIQSQPGPAKTDSERFGQMQAADIGKLTDAELDEKVKNALRKKGKA